MKFSNFTGLVVRRKGAFLRWSLAVAGLMAAAGLYVFAVHQPTYGEALSDSELDALLGGGTCNDSRCTDEVECEATGCFGDYFCQRDPGTPDKCVRLDEGDFFKCSEGGTHPGWNCASNTQGEECAKRTTGDVDKSGNCPESACTTEAGTCGETLFYCYESPCDPGGT